MTDNSTPAGPAPESQTPTRSDKPLPPDEQTRDTFFQEVRDAVLLLEFAVSEGRVLEATLIIRVKKSQGFLSHDAPWPSDQDRADFESAYRDLAQTMKPITAATLRATMDERWKPSPARRFSQRLYIWVFISAAFIVAYQALTIAFPAPQQGAAAPEAFYIRLIRGVGPNLMPFVFGLVGALTFLLRSAHIFIAERTFDMNRRPEYYNRMVLGFLGGGVALLFVGNDSKVGQNAISFLVGYNTDYLFQMIERVAQAVFPKETKPQTVPILAGISLERDSLGPGDAGNATVSITGVAPSGGLLVSLTADSGIELSATTVKIPEGSNSASFTFKVDQSQKSGTKLHVTAKQDSSSMTATITVK